jgi:hypothetical protein
MKTRAPLTISATFGALLVFTAPLFGANVEQLQRGFDRPPDNTRIMARWWWFGPAVTKPQLEREMKFMKEGGLGGFEVQPTYPLALDDEWPGLKNIKFLSPEFFDALKFTAQKANELGLRMDLTMGSGWPYGGSMFSASEAAGRLVTQVAAVTAGQKSVPAPQLRAGQTLIAAFVGKPGSGAGARGRGAGEGTGGAADVREMKEVPVRDGAAQIPADAPDSAEVVFFISGRTGMQVKRPAFGAEGNVIDHLSAQVVDKFIHEVAEPEVKACDPYPPHAVFCDSLEVGGEDWTDDLLAEFQQRRGYDLRPFLPALIGDMGEKTYEIRHDWGRTLTELFNDHFNTRLEKFAKEHKTRFRIQGYGSPSAALYSYAYADLAEGEGYQWHGYRASRYGASAAHLMNLPVASSETFTWLHSPVFRATPLDMKSEGDMHFLQGINQIICHGWPYTAEGAAYPGWSFYAAAVFNQNNPWWIVMPDVAKYLQRVSFMMRQGTPANDIALYLANSDTWANFTLGHISLTDGVGHMLGPKIVPAILDAGYNLDFFDDGMLDLRGKVENGALVFGNLRYKVVVLAGVQRIPVSTMRKLEEFARGGGIVVATRNLPSIAPGYKATEDDQKTVKDTAQRLFKEADAPGLFIEDETQFGAMLAKRLAPDVVMSPASPEIGVVHRHTDSGEIYFLANTGNQPKTVKASFRVEDMQPEMWNPMNGSVGPVQIAEKPAGATAMNLKLEPYGSTIIVFTKRSLPTPKPAPSIASMPQAVDLSAGWTVKFGKDAKPVPMEKLRSWTDNAATSNFSGVATYEKTITVPAEMLKAGLALSFNFGESAIPQASGGGRSGMGYRTALETPVRDAAILYINDKRVGSVWSPPYAIDVTGQFRRGQNKIRIEVANLAVNYMASIKFPNYNYAGVTQKYGNRFQPQNLDQIQPLPSGLLGPIRLIATGQGKS